MLFSSILPISPVSLTLPPGSQVMRVILLVSYGVVFSRSPRGSLEMRQLCLAQYSYT